MIKSMTGYGRGEFKVGDKEFLVEVRSINHRYLDFFIKVPRKISFLEEKVRKYVSNVLSRGKIDIFITYENYGDDSKSVIIDEFLSKSYVNALKDLSDKFSLTNDSSASLIANFPDVLKVQKGDEDENELWSLLESALKKGMDSLIEMRSTEGEKLKKDILKKLEVINKEIDNVSVHSNKVVSDYKERLETRLNELLEQKSVDENRIATEVAIFADRCSIDEELVRLKSHVNQVKKTLEIEKPIGRKLDFIMQEMNREINTIGSKANNLDITNSVVEVKCEVEKIREQVQNIE
jgi:uncharacterized protein (TIGR00255 family)